MTEVQETVPEMVRRLALARKRAEEIRAALEPKKEALLRTYEDENHDLLEESRNLLTLDSDLQAAIKSATLAAYEADRTNKKPYPACGVRVSEKPVYEASTALKWATEHKLCLTLDTKSFGSLCESPATRPDFVTMSELRTPTIATDLSIYAGGNEND